MFLVKFSMHNSIYNCINLKLGDFLINIESLPREIKMYRICTAKISCGSGYIVSGARLPTSCCYTKQNALHEIRFVDKYFKQNHQNHPAHYIYFTLSNKIFKVSPLTSYKPIPRLYRYVIYAVLIQTLAI